MSKCGLIVSFLALSFLAGCSTPAPVSDAVLFHPMPEQAKIFLYVQYDDVDDKPTFDETFQILAPGYEGDIDDSQYVVKDVDPGEYKFSVNEVDWGGRVAHSTFHVTHVQAGKIYFYTAHVQGDALRLLKTDNVTGAQAVKARRLFCQC